MERQLVKRLSRTVENRHARRAMAASVEGSKADVTSGWAPKIPFDMATGKPAAFRELVGAYDEWHRADPADPAKLIKLNGTHKAPQIATFPMTTGVFIITPAVAEQLLRLNPVGANRKAEFGNVNYYGTQMSESDGWKLTGQALIFDEHGTLVDGQHRLWACLLSGVSFVTWVITGIPAEEKLFAYIDAGRSRTHADALYTAGYGQPSLASSIVRLAAQVPHYSMDSSGRKQKLTSITVLRLAAGLPNLPSATRLAASDWEEAADIVGKSGDMICGYLGMRIMDAYDEEAADDFFTELGDEVGDYPENGPIIQLRKLLKTDKLKEKPMKRPALLANMIRGFNLWKQGVQTVPKKWQVGSHEDFPLLDGERQEESKAA